MRSIGWFFMVSITVVASCVTVADQPLRILYESASKRPATDYQAQSDKGMVVAAHPLASAAGALMLEKGGTAMDAAVAASFVISVVRPQSTGLGGGGFMLVHDQMGKRQRIFDFRERAPHLATSDMYATKSGVEKIMTYEGHPVKDPSINGHLAVAIPGLVKGLLEAHKEYGKLDLKDVIAPAIEIARNGFPVYKELADDIVDRKEWLWLYPSSRKIFFKGDLPLKVGDALIQTDLSLTLSEIANSGAKDFYEGEIARKIVKEIERGHGLIDAKDLRNYKVIERAPVKGMYRGHRIVSMPPPSSGGTHIIEMLNMLETKDLKELHPRGATYLHLLSEVMRRAFADRAKEMGDADFVAVPVAKLTSKVHARELMKSFDPNHATDSKLFSQIGATSESQSTTHMSVVDHWGNAVATTQTVNYEFGSCVVAEGTGIVLNDEMDDFTAKPGVANVFGLVQGIKNIVEPGKTPLSSMSPTMVFDDGGHLELVLGSPGGPRIINAVLQTIVNVLDFKMPLLEAVHSTRIHHQWLPNEIKVEDKSLDEDTKITLAQMGHQWKPIHNIGDVQAVQVRSDRLMIGVSDSRSDGRPVAPTK
jgi:gamma-glutamyltranspeptidase / glutathione hydrolase